MNINNIDDLKRTAHELKNEIDEESAFEKLLSVLVGYGMDEDQASHMIADCIDEQYELDEVSKLLNDIYQDTKEVVINNGNEYKA